MMMCAGESGLLIGPQTPPTLPRTLPRRARGQCSTLPQRLSRHCPPRRLPRAPSGGGPESGVRGIYASGESENVSCARNAFKEHSKTSHDVARGIDGARECALDLTLSRARALGFEFAVRTPGGTVALRRRGNLRGGQERQGELRVCASRRISSVFKSPSAPLLSFRERPHLERSRRREPRFGWRALSHREKKARRQNSRPHTAATAVATLPDTAAVASATLPAHTAAPDVDQSGGRIPPRTSSGEFWQCLAVFGSVLGGVQHCLPRPNHVEITAFTNAHARVFFRPPDWSRGSARDRQNTAQTRRRGRVAHCL
jgi:hypothetical protein